MSGFPTGGARRTAPGGINTRVSTATPSAVPVPVPVPYSSGSQQLDQLARILGIAGTVAAQQSSLEAFERSQLEGKMAEIDRTNYRNKMERERAEAEAKRDAENARRAIEESERGRGSKAGMFQYTEIAQAISTGELAPEGDEELESFFARVMEPHTEGMSEAYKEGFESRFLEAAVSSYRGRQAQVVAAARQTLVEDWTNAGIAYGADADGLKELYGVVALSLNVTPERAARDIGLKVAEFHAKADDLEAFDAVAETIDTSLPEVPQLRAGIINRREAKDRDAQAQIEEDIWKQINNSGGSYAGIEQAIAESELDESTKARLGQVIENKREADLRAQQDTSYNLLMNNAMGIPGSKLAPNEVLDEAYRRSDAAGMDPSNPDYLSAGQINAIENEVLRKVDRDERKARVNRAMNGSAAVLTSEDQHAIGEAWVERGMISDDGKTIDHKKLARGIAASSGQWPTRFAKQWADMAGSGEETLVKEAMAIVALAHAVEPAYAENLTSTFSPVAQVKARTVLQALEDGNASMLGDQGTAQLTINRAVRETMAFTEDMAGVTDREVRGLLLYGDPAKAPSEFEPDARAKMVKLARKYDVHKPEGRTGQSNWYISLGINKRVMQTAKGTGRSFATPGGDLSFGYTQDKSIEITTPVLNHFSSSAIEKYRALGAVPAMVRDPERRKQTALEWAADSTRNNFTVMEWGGRRFFLEGNLPGGVEFTAGRLLKEDIESSLPESVANDLWANYTPIWRPDLAGYVFQNNAEPSEFYNYQGQTLVQDPLAEAEDRDNPQESDYPASIVENILQRRVTREKVNTLFEGQSQFDALGPGGPF
jgi:hypothetical protein